MYPFASVKIIVGKENKCQPMTGVITDVFSRASLLSVLNRTTIAGRQCEPTIKSRSVIFHQIVDIFRPFCSNIRHRLQRSENIIYRRLCITHEFIQRGRASAQRHFGRLAIPIKRFPYLILIELSSPHWNAVIYQARGIIRRHCERGRVLFPI